MSKTQRLQDAVPAAPPPRANLTNTVDDGHAMPAPAFNSIEEQKTQQVPDSSQAVRIPGSGRFKPQDQDQTDRLRAVPAVPVSVEPKDIPLAAHEHQPSALVENATDPTDFSDMPDAEEEEFEEELPPPVPAPSRAAPPPAAMSSAPGDRLVVVRPRTTFDCTIGDNRWYFTKDKACKVPQSVKEVLARGEAIYP